MTQRPPRTPAETAMRDQATALVRDLTRSGIPVVFADYANGAQCSWCDCPITPDSPHNGEDYACSGCPNTASAELRLHPAEPRDKSLPVCQAHHEDALQFLAALMAYGESPG